MKQICIGCGRELEGQDYSFHVLEVRTLPVRDLDREKKVQGLGGFRDFGVCRECAGKQLEKETGPLSSAGRRTAGFGAVLLAGAALLAADLLWLQTDRVFLMLSLAAILCGIIGVVTSLQEGGRRKAALLSMDNRSALSDCAFAVLTERAPRKDKDTDLTYIPVDAQTMKRKNGDLMILYHLLPEIAVKAYEMIHQEYHRLRGGER